MLAAAGLTAAGALLAAPALSQGRMQWRMANLYPRGISFGVAYESFADRVAAITDGRLRIDNVYDGEGVGATEVLSATRSGLVEMGSPYMALHAGELPAGLVELGLPGGPERYDQIYTLSRRGGWDAILQDAYGSIGLRHIGSVLQPGVLLLTKRPINSLSDLQGMRLRSPGAYGRFMAQFGATPVTMAFGETYTSLATGVIDGCASSNLIDYRDGRWYEQAQYLYPLPVSGSQTAPIVVNADAWNRLPADLQAALVAANVEHCFEHVSLSIVDVGAAVTEMRAGGAAFTASPGEADRAAWRAAAASVWGEFAEGDAHSRRLIDAQTAFMESIG
ncbi:MAG: TRAP transporter substrate-binding protein DctP [Gemmobacter sp.]